MNVDRAFYTAVGLGLADTVAFGAGGVLQAMAPVSLTRTPLTFWVVVVLFAISFVCLVSASVLLLMARARLRHDIAGR